MRGSEHLLRETCLLPLCMFPQSHNTRKMHAPTPSDLFPNTRYSWCPFASENTARPLPLPSLPLSNMHLNSKFTFWFYIFYQKIQHNLKFQVTECVLAEAGCTTLSFKNSPQISLASWICSQNITLLFVILFLQLFLKCFSVLPKLPRLCCYSNTADGTGVKQALWKLTVFLEKSTKWTSTSKWLKSFSSDGENNSETYCDTTWAVSPQ